MMAGPLSSRIATIYLSMMSSLKGSSTILAASGSRSSGHTHKLSSRNAEERDQCGFSEASSRCALG